MSDKKQSLIEKASRLKNRYYFLFMLIGMAGFSLILKFVFIPIGKIMEPTGKGIQDLMNAFKAEEAKIILDAWKDIIPVVQKLTYFDFLFPLVNAIFIISILILLYKNIQNVIIKKIISIAFIISMLGCVFDWIENVFTLILLNPGTSHLLFLALFLSIFAKLKFGCTIIKYVTFLISLFVLIFEKIRGTKQV